MKKRICFVLVVLVMLSCLTACNFTQSTLNSLADKAEATPKVEAMMSALAENRISDAIGLIHPQKAENSEDTISQICSYLDGRKTSSIVPESINVNSSVSTSGKARQEELVYKVTLTDGAVVYLNVVYLSDNEGTGFTSFQLVLGVV